MGYHDQSDVNISANYGQSGEKDTIKKVNHRTKKSNALIITENLLLHQELINSIMIDMKPNLIHIFFKRYTKEMIKTYLRGVRDDFKQNRPGFILTPDESNADIEN